MGKQRVFGIWKARHGQLVQIEVLVLVRKGKPLVCVTVVERLRCLFELGAWLSVRQCEVVLGFLLLLVRLLKW